MKHIFFTFVMLALFSTHAHAKDRIAILPFDGKGGMSVKNDVADALAAFLSRYSDFVVLERMRIEDVLKEHDLADKGWIDPSEAVAAGKLLGADHVVLGRVTEMADGYDGKTVISASARIVDVKRGVVKDGALGRGQGYVPDAVTEVAKSLSFGLTHGRQAPIKINNSLSRHFVFSYQRTIVTGFSQPELNSFGVSFHNSRRFRAYDIELGFRFASAGADESLVIFDLGTGFNFTVVPYLLRFYAVGGASYVGIRIPTGRDVTKTDTGGIYGRAAFALSAPFGTSLMGGYEHRKFFERTGANIEQQVPEKMNQFYNNGLFVAVAVGF